MKNNTGLVEYAKAQLGKPYWYGTFGNLANAVLYSAKQKQYPGYYKPWSDFPMQYGQRVHDCVGLIKGYLWSECLNSVPKYNAKQDVSANGMRSICADKGNIDTIPDIPGVLVFIDGHVGVYIGDGKVIEAAGHQYGVVQTDLKERRLDGRKVKPWKYWGKCLWIDYGADIKVIIKSGTWNVRKGSSTSFDVIKVINGGEIYNSSRSENGWYFIDTLDGWVSGKAVVI